MISLTVEAVKVSSPTVSLQHDVLKEHQYESSVCVCVCSPTLGGGDVRSRQAAV